jgi:hypothetical protein
MAAVSFSYRRLGHGRGRSDTILGFVREPYVELVRVACYIEYRLHHCRDHIQYTSIWYTNTERYKNLLHCLILPLSGITLNYVFGQSQTF